ncbi:zinc ribbon domain-containing protein [Rhodocaloribacter litoris]|uniref:double zinc ribbon domain-containing protein n=1 Tax=Rhodocaloribacter litoris TaxID=2558931 RepID=UPI0014234D85|nr:zinc ribbon domain-containing protein [Rhodocaloribacter litoris]QXD16637.1 zinc ribbon domain-containing protein [Rhodocaloribacter litoris]
MKELVCEGCGARLPGEASRCDLCGTPVETPGAGDAAEAIGAAGTEPGATPEAVPAGIFCNACGWSNPPAARFCSRCGARLDERVAALHGVAAPPPSSPGTPAPHAHAAHAGPTSSRASSPAGVGRQVGILIGAGVLLVLGLYLITLVSKGVERGPAPAQPAAQAAPAPATGPLPEDVAARAEALAEEINRLTGEAALEKRRELVRLYAQAGRYDLAAAEQKSLAERENTEEAWVLAGNLYYDWMERQTGTARTLFARQAIAAYRKALEINPDNLDVRTDMAIAYLYDPEQPMKAIEETNAVLARDPNHVQANFNRGLMLLQINRVDQALEQFEKVKTIVGNPNDPVYQRAEQVIATLRNQQTGAGAGS